MMKTTSPGNNKTNKPDMIMMMKILNGDTLIGMMIDDDEKVMIVKDVCQVVTMIKQDDEGMTKAVYYTEWFPFGDSTVHMLMKSHLVSASLPSERAVREYGEYIARRKEMAQGEKKEGNNWGGLDFKLDGDPGRMNN
jgi:hypothetical protein